MTASSGVDNLDLIIVAEGASRPHLSAARRVAELLDLPVEESATPRERALNIGPPDFALADATAAALIGDAPADGPWDVVCETDAGGWLVTGSSARSAAHATLRLVDSLRWGDELPSPWRRLTQPAFRSLALEFDDWSGGFARMADGFDIRVHAADAARVGMTTLEVNLLADVVPVQVRERRVPDDMYQWWDIYSAALDMFVESDLTRGTYHRDMLARNMDKLLETADAAREWGLTPTFIAFEPRAWPERLYDHYPQLRGARVDCSDYSAEAEYAPDPNHPLVIEHYREMMQRLMERIPDLGLISVWSQDSCAGFPWAEKLYPGPNGPRAARKRPVEEGVVNLMTALRDGGRAINPDLQVTICGSWFVGDELPRICDALPDDIGVSYTVGRGGQRPSDGSRSWEIVETIRAHGIEPQVQLEEVSNPWKPLGPMLGFPFPYLCHGMLRDAKAEGGVQDLILRGGIQSEVFVPNFINNEVIRAFGAEGLDLDLDDLLARRASAWTNTPDDARRLVEAWGLCDEAVSNYSVRAWTVTLVSARTLWRRLVRPLTPDQSRLTWEDWRYYRHLEFNVGADDPAWLDHFYKGWGRMIDDGVAREAVVSYDEVMLPRLREAVAALDASDEMSEVARDCRDRIRCLHHALTTERNMLQIQERIHACLADDREHPETSEHLPIIREAMSAEMDNTREFIELLDSSPSTLLPSTSGIETTYMLRAPISHLLRQKLISMERHFDDAPGPWFDELLQPGGWTSDAGEGDTQ
jgi:hypothetical protein